MASSSSMPQMSQVNNMAYQNIPSEQYWSANPPTTFRGDDVLAQEAKARRNRNLKIGAIILAILAVIGIVVGVVVSQVTKKSGDGNSQSSSGNTGTSTTDNEGNAVVGSDPSQFDKDSRLHQSFWAFAYTPQVSQIMLQAAQG